MLCSVYGTARYSVWELSHGLSQIEVTHQIISNRMRRKVGSGRVIASVSAEPELLDVKFTNFISASVSELSLTNFTQFSGLGLLEDLREALSSPTVMETAIRPMTMADYVNWIAKPSALNLIQTEIYKINPYSLRKRTQELVLDFFNSRITLAKTIARLQDNLKHDRLVPLLIEAVPLRDAVARLSTETVAAVVESTGLQSFDLCYLASIRKKETKC